MTIEDVTVIHAPVERCFDLARSVEVHLWRNVHCAAQTTAIAGVTSGLVGMGQRVTWRAKHFGVWHNLTAEITAMDRPVYFRNTMIQGIFRLMKHDHIFRSVSIEVTEMKNVYCFAAPLSVLGRAAEISFLRRYMQALLRERTAAVKEIAESSRWQEYLP